MQVEPLYRREWSESAGEFVVSDELLGYQALGADGKVLGEGETIADAIESAMRTMWE